MTRNWTARMEYLYIDLREKDVTLAFAGLPAIQVGNSVSQNVVRLGLNYRF